MSGACRFKSAWADPEHMRLAIGRSWWDVNSGGPAQRGPLPEDQNPWLNAAPVPAEPPQEVADAA